VCRIGPALRNVICLGEIATSSTADVLRDGDIASNPMVSGSGLIRGCCICDRCRDRDSIAFRAADRGVDMVDHCRYQLHFYIAV
jgi:hypothetical protein